MQQQLSQLLQEFSQKQAVIDKEINVIEQQIQDLEEQIENCRFRLGVVAEDKERVLSMKERYASDSTLPTNQKSHSEEKKQSLPEPAKGGKSLSPKLGTTSKPPSKGTSEKSFASSLFKSKDTSSISNQPKDAAKSTIGFNKDSGTTVKGGATLTFKSSQTSAKGISATTKGEVKAQASASKPEAKTQVPPPQLPKPDIKAPPHVSSEIKPPPLTPAFTPPSFIYATADQWATPPEQSEAVDLSLTANEAFSQPITEPIPEPAMGDMPAPITEPMEEPMSEPEQEPTPTPNQQPVANEQTTLDLGSGDGKDKAADDDTVKSINDALRGLFR